MKILFLTPYPAHQAPSQRFRFEQYFDLIEKNGFAYTIKPFISESTWQILYQPGHRLKKIIGIIHGFIRRLMLMFDLGKYDYVFIHREASPIGPPIFEWLISKVLQKKVIYDFDDAIWLQNTSASNNIAAGLKWHHKVSKICKWSYKVSCGNSYLCEFAKKYNNNVILNPTTIDTVNLHNPELINKSVQSKKLVIGWTGTHSTLKYLKPLVPLMQRLENSQDFIFRIISNHPPALSIKSLEYIPWNKVTEIQDLNTFDIGIMPLSDDKWAKGKCGFKALQYLSLGIPALVSPVGVNNVIIQHDKNGYLCDSLEDWEKYLIMLIKDGGKRKILGKQGRSDIINNYSVKSNANNFMKLFT